MEENTLHKVELRIKGKVQGVGFRPFVWTLAQQLSLKGVVLNDGLGVLIRFSNITNDQLTQFTKRLRSEAPPLAEITSIEKTESIKKTASVKMSDFAWQTAPDGFSIPDSFSIVESESTEIDTQIVPDAATCPSCLEEILSPEANIRRKDYGFNNCTHCGPRFTIIHKLPYDRPYTAMAEFPMCDACRQEYQNPADRRYHAQPIACTQCGPQINIVFTDGSQSKQQKQSKQQNWISATLEALNKGKIIAIKSLGGFHLVCDATNDNAVMRLRQRKHRQCKPFAVMVSDLEQAKKIATINQYESTLLQSAAAPIVLLQKSTSSNLSHAIAPELNEVGVMLPSNPVQHLIAHYIAKPLVMTSANASGLPPAITNTQALEQLNDIADLYLFHNRDIVQRCDDSLVRGHHTYSEMLRRSRGYVPDAISLPKGFPDASGYISYGGDLKSAFALGNKQQIIVSQYLGDLTNLQTQQQYTESMQHYTALYGIQPAFHAFDCHPGYFSHQYGASKEGHHIAVQHHHAHIAACLLENGWPADGGQVLALVLDGLGYGDNGEFWGAELMLADYQSYQRVGGIPAVTLPGGDSAAKQPWRSLFAHLNACYLRDPELPWQQYFSNKLHFSDKSHFSDTSIALLQNAIKSGINCHSVRSAGRLFDAVAASLGICFDHVEYEGQAACHLEALAQRFQHKDRVQPLDINIIDNEVDLASFWHAFLHYDADKEEKAYLFHLSLATVLAKLVRQAKPASVNHLVLSGGVFHNALLTQLLIKALSNEVTVLQHKLFSCGDGNLALGQMAVALITTNANLNKE